MSTSKTSGECRPKGRWLRLSCFGSVALAVFAGLPVPGVVAQEASQAAGDGERAVERLAGGDRVGTAVELARSGWPAGADTVLLATADDFPDALAAGPLAAARDAPLLLTARDELSADVASELRRLEPDQVILVGGPDALDSRVEDEVHNAGFDVERIAGRDRFATAAAIAERAGAPASTYAVASGSDFADGVAAGAFAATPSRPPTLLVEADAVPSATREALADLGLDEGARARIVGGTAAVSEAVAGQLPGTAERLAGPTRFETSAAVLSDVLGALGPEPRPLLVTTGEIFPDALASGGLAARVDAALLMVPGRELSDGLADLIASNRHRFDQSVLVGGTSAISDLVQTQLERVLNGMPRDQPPVWRPALASAVDYAGTRSGSISFAAIGTDGALVGHRPDTTVPIASVLKVMFMVAYLRQPDVRDRDLAESDRAVLEPMIRQSANDPATEIANRLGPGPLDELAALAGMQDFAFTRPWGLTRTSARDQAPFMLRLQELLPPRHAAYALRLLTEVVPEQRWGVGEVPVPLGWTVHFKGGWGSGSGAVDHQVVLVRHCSGAQAALAVMTTSSPSHAYGNETLRGVFQRLLETLPAQEC